MAPLRALRLAFFLTSLASSTSFASSIAAEVSFPDSLAWLLFTNGLFTSARNDITTRGDANLIAPLFRTVAVMANRDEPAVGET